MLRGGGELVSFYAKEPDLAAEFAKRYPQAKLARSEKEIIEDGTINNRERFYTRGPRQSGSK